MKPTPQPPQPSNHHSSPPFTITKMPAPSSHKDQHALRGFKVFHLKPVSKPRFRSRGRGSPCSEKLKSKWWNLGFLFATPVVSKWNSMPMVRFLWLVVIANFPFAGIVSTTKSRRDIKFASAVALPLVVPLLLGFLLDLRLFLFPFKVFVYIR